MKRDDGRSRAASMFFDHFSILPSSPDEELLHRIVSEFARIPWENLTKFLNKSRCHSSSNRLRLADAVIREHIEKGAGGTCFSLTEALGAVLEYAGYRCGTLMADMSHGKNIHCALLVVSDQGKRFLADPGYLVPEPIPLEPGITAEIDVCGQHLVWKPCAGGSYRLVTSEGEKEEWRYEIRTDPVGREEFIHHWDRSFDATGMNSLHANLRAGSVRLSAHNMNLRRVSSEGKENRKLRDEYATWMEKYFGISREIALEAEREWRRSCRDR